MNKRFRISVITCSLLLAVFSGVVSGRAPSFKITEDHVKGLSPKMQREIAALQYLLNPYQLNQFFSLASDSLRGVWISVFWKSLDPTPTTPENEMMIEHYVRTRMAMDIFGSATWPGWDKRGEIFIRYGAPDYRGIIPSEVTVRKVYPPGELWFYRRHAMVTQFDDFNLDGNYKYAITPLGVARDMNTELIEFLLYDTEDALQELIPENLLNFQRPAEIIENEVDWTQYHEAMIGVQPEQHVRLRMKGVYEGMDEMIDPDTRSITPDNPSDQFHKRRMEEFATNFEVTLEETPSSYPFNFEDKTLPLYFSIDQFKGGDKVNRVEVNLEFAADLSPGDEDEKQKTYTATAVFLDSDFSEVAHEDRKIELPTAPGSEDGATRLIPAQLVFTLPDEYYRLAVSVEEAETGRNSAYRSTMVFFDYSYDLAISDVLFASKIAPAERQSPFNRGALEVVPHPLRRYKKSNVVPVYFEIYNLELDEYGSSQYTVEYRIVPHSLKKYSFWERYNTETPIVSSRFESSSYGSTDYVDITFRTDNLWKSAFDLLITVKDEITQAVVYRRVAFRIVE